MHDKYIYYGTVVEQTGTVAGQTDMPGIYDTVVVQTNMPGISLSFQVLKYPLPSTLSISLFPH